jgi:hypothetical protein
MFTEPTPPMLRVNCYESPFATLRFRYPVTRHGRDDFRAKKLQHSTRPGATAAKPVHQRISEKRVQDQLHALEAPALLLHSVQRMQHHQ